MPVLPPEEVIALLRQRAARLAAMTAEIETHLAAITAQDIEAVAGDEPIPPALAGRKFPPLFVVEAEFRLALIKAELAFVQELVPRLVEDGWGPLTLWRDLQTAAARNHKTAGEHAMS